MNQPKKHYSIQIRGIVQGVGFRPFIHQLAGKCHLAGEVRNDSRGVSLEVEGTEAALGEFLRQIPSNAPPLAVIDSIQWAEGPVTGLSGFSIGRSEKTGGITLISPDIATCADCLRELFDPSDRRFGYPFINCTNCGPRFTIIRDLPYDRPATTMDVFQMCPACEREYGNPADRRFHAQPNACWSCGPRCELQDNHGRFIPCPDPIRAAIDLLGQGNIVAVKGLGGFHLAADAGSEETVRNLRRRKRRDEKPFAIMAASLEKIREFALVPPEAEIHLRSPQRPIVLLPKLEASSLAPAVAPGNRYLGVMLPYTPIHHLLLDKGAFPALVMTSGNFSEEPIITDNRMAVDILAPVADFFLTHNREILIRNDDSISRPFRGRNYFLRRSRGYAPAPIRLSRRHPPILAVGGELKNTVALSRDEYVFISQHIGDLENSEVFSSFESIIEHLKTLLRITPEILAHDLHPEYLSTKYALAQTAPAQVVGVQHHHAHVAACMAENDYFDPVIGISFDGTGYGLDGKIWGGEILLAGLRDFQRLFHFKYIAMPGGAHAIREPWRMAVSLLYDAYGPDFSQLPVPFLKTIEHKKLELVVQMLDRRLNCPETSSCGRLFDGLAALTGLRLRNSFEGQAAMELEMVLMEENHPGYKFERRQESIDAAPVIRAAVEDLAAGLSAGSISYRFHRGLVNLVVDLCEEIRARENIGTVALSGGVFQNIWLLDRLEEALSRIDFRVLTHRLVPCNDGGISVGQLVVAAEKCSAERR